MRLVLHPKVSSDISKIMEFYEQVATAELAIRIADAGFLDYLNAGARLRTQRD
jgi:hypothetical protein